MRFTSSGGSPAEITPAMAKALREAEAVPEKPGALRLRGEHSSQTVSALERLGLAAYDRGGATGSSPRPVAGSAPG